MLEQIKEVIDNGYQPVIFVESDLLVMGESSHELLQVTKTARLMNVNVVYNQDVESLNRLRKAYVFRYGHIPSMTEAMIKRKGGVVVSGNLKLAQ